MPHHRPQATTLGQPVGRNQPREHDAENHRAVVPLLSTPGNSQAGAATQGTPDTNANGPGRYSQLEAAPCGVMLEESASNAARASSCIDLDVGIFPIQVVGVPSQRGRGHSTRMVPYCSSSLSEIRSQGADAREDIAHVVGV